MISRKLLRMVKAGMVAWFRRHDLWRQVENFETCRERFGGRPGLPMPEGGLADAELLRTRSFEAAADPLRVSAAIYYSYDSDRFFCKAVIDGVRKHTA
jgi:hypothetical protein